jgi:hypothetical protein
MQWLPDEVGLAVDQQRMIPGVVSKCFLEAASKAFT